MTAYGEYNCVFAYTDGKDVMCEAMDDVCDGGEDCCEPISDCSNCGKWDRNNVE